MTYRFEVATSPHDEVKDGVLCKQRTRVLVSEEAYSYAEAVHIAACMAVAVHGGMPTEVIRV